MESNIRLREFIPEQDGPMVDRWAVAHGRDRLPVAMLPPDGAILELFGRGPIAAAWLYKCLGVGVAFIEHVHTVPGLTLAEARNAVRILVEYFRFNAREDGYGVMLATTIPALAREAERSGWTRLGDGRVSIMRETGLAEIREEAA